MCISITLRYFGEDSVIITNDERDELDILIREWGFDKLRNMFKNGFDDHVYIKSCKDKHTDFNPFIKQYKICRNWREDKDGASGSYYLWGHRIRVRISGSADQQRWEHHLLPFLTEAGYDLSDDSK